MLIYANLGSIFFHLVDFANYNLGSQGIVTPLLITLKILEIPKSCGLLSIIHYLSCIFGLRVLEPLLTLIHEREALISY